MKKQFLSIILIACMFLTTATIPASAASGPVSSNNIGKQNYSNWHYSSPVTSYLYENEAGGLTRVEYINNQVIIENYDDTFAFQSGKTISDNLLPLWGGCFIGERYNFLISGQWNMEENDEVEVIRVMKYSKDWEYLGQVGLYGANTSSPFNGGSLRCDEYGDYLYIHTAHLMYQNKDDGLNHQANLTMVVKQSDMTITDSQYGVSSNSHGYVSHSFNQYIIIDEAGSIVTLDHGDGYPPGYCSSSLFF